MVTAREVREGGREIEGALGQISLVDLLQIFSLNRKTGQLEIKSGSHSGQVYIQDGSVVHAGTGRHRGEKALFRMLHWKEGSFTFAAERTTADQNIRRSTDLLLLEGARQADELARLRADLPADPVRLVIVPGRAGRFEGLHPVTQEILGLLEFYGTVGELIEHARVSDFEACRAIRTLLDKGVLAAAAQQPGDSGEEQPLLGHDALFELKGRLSAGVLPQARSIRGKICLLCAEERLLKEFMTAFKKVPGAELAGSLDALRRGFGLVGQLKLSENLSFDLMLLPHPRGLRPLWEPLGAGVSGALVLRSGPADQALPVAEALAQQLSRAGAVPVLDVEPGRLAQIRMVLIPLLGRIAGQAKTSKAG
jgi:hypothetical protein